jgi:PRTRC genetic system protein B
MWFRVGKFSGSFEVKWPSLLFIANKRDAKLFVFALAASSYPSEDAIVYHAPLMNIGRDGLVCQGSASLPAEISSATIDQMEETIYDSNFTHINHSTTLNNVKTSDGKVGTKEHLAFWRSRHKSKANLPKKHLVRYSTLSGMMAKLR